MGMAGIKDIAEAAGVSLSTVSNVINGKRNVGKKTREKVLQLIEEMDYVPNEAGKLLKTKENHTILFVFSDFDRSFYLEVLKGVNDYLKNKDYDLLICTQRSCEKYMRNNMSSGCIVLDAALRDNAILRCANENYPIVALDRTCESPYVRSVIVDNYPAMCEMMQDIIDRGYRRFAFLSGVETSLDNMERYRGFSDTIEKSGLHFHQKNYFVGDYREESGYTVGKILSLAENLPDALICANDRLDFPVTRLLPGSHCSFSHISQQPHPISVMAGGAMILEDICLVTAMMRWRHDGISLVCFLRLCVCTVRRMNFWVKSRGGFRRRSIR